MMARLLVNGGGLKAKQAGGGWRSRSEASGVLTGCAIVVYCRHKRSMALPWYFNTFAQAIPGGIA